MKTRSDARKERLAAALRENLKRRKAQTRAIAAAGQGADEPAGCPDSKTGENGPKDAAKNT